MEIKTATVKYDVEHIAYRDLENVPNHVDYMVKAKKETHDPLVAQCLGIASAWAYSDVDTFARMMHRQGGMPNNETVSIRSENKALLVDTTAYLVQSHDKRLAVVAFRGTDFQNLSQMLTDMSARVDQFWTLGRVHGGFYRAALILWPTIQYLLHVAMNSASICAAATTERSMTHKDRCQSEPPARATPDQPSTSSCERESDRSGPGTPPGGDATAKEKLPVLYLTGHSLGGALAVLTAALLFQDPNAEPIWDRLRGIYTYGQPMVGREDFANQYGGTVGRKLFRHVYRRDLIPRLPPWSAGSFRHIGSEFRETSEGGWLHRTATVNQSFSFVVSMFIGLVAPVLGQLGSVPVLSRMRLPFSLGDHSPLNYLRTSQIIPVGSEFR